jgi:ganglioside GM2 activator
MRLAVAALFFLVTLALTVQANKILENPELLNKPQILGRDQTPPREPLTFNWKNCGAATDPTKLNSLSVTPDPIVLGQNITVIASGYLSEDVSGSGFSVALDIYKSVFGVWVYIPCVDNVGSCTIPDICSVLKPRSDCPVAKWGIPCNCPFKAGNYQIPSPGFSVHLKNPDLSWLTDGDFMVQATVTDPNGNRMICLQVTASITTA